MISKVPFVWLDPRLDMPAWLLAGVGGIAAEWAYLEWTLEEAMRILHQTDVKAWPNSGSGNERAHSRFVYLRASSIPRSTFPLSRIWEGLEKA